MHIRKVTTETMLFLPEFSLLSALFAQGELEIFAILL